MKKSEELLGLSVISIEDGKEVGRIGDLVINSAKGSVEFLIVDHGPKYLGIKILPFQLVEGVGENAVTIQSSSSITNLADQPEISGLLEKDVRVKGTKVLTKKGKVIGTVAEFFIDEDNQGVITGCEVTPAGEADQTGIVPADQIITFGKDVLVINEGAAFVTADSLASSARATAVKPLARAVSPAEDETQAEEAGTEPSEAARLFEERQRQYLLGRTVGKRLETENGEIIAEEGDLITEELLDKVKAAGKFTELSMNTKA